MSLFGNGVVTDEIEWTQRLVPCLEEWAYAGVFSNYTGMAASRLAEGDGLQVVIAEARRFNVIAAGRRWGKNVLAEIKIIETLLAGRPAAWFSPTYKTLEEDWRRLLTILHPLIASKNQQDHRAVLVTGGTLEMWSLDAPDTARGRAYARVVIDEAASVPALLYCWQNVIRPMLLDYSGDAWFISTPAGLNDFYTLYEWGQDPARPEWRSWQRPSSENPHLPREDLAQSERDQPVRVFQAEYLAKFLPDGVGQFFSEWDPAVHICPAFEIPMEWRRFGMLDYGHIDPFCYLQIGLSGDGRGFVSRTTSAPAIAAPRSVRPRPTLQSRALGAQRPLPACGRPAGR